MHTKFTNNNQKFFLAFTFKLFENLPLILPIGLAIFSLSSVFFLVLGQFHAWLVWPIGLFFALGSMIITWKNCKRTERPGTLKEKRTFDILIILCVLLWLIFNTFNTAQNIFIVRDPAVYTNTGKWLVGHSELAIPATDIFQDLKGFSPTGAGFGIDQSDKSTIYAQGMHLLPALLGATGKIMGDKMIFHLNPFLGALALLSIYGFARLLIRPRFAALITGVLAISLPFIHFSTDNYTELLSSTFIFTALSLLWIAQKNRKKSLWFLAGLLAGSGTLTRIDGYLTLVALTAFLSLWLAFGKSEDRNRRVSEGTVLSIGAVIPSLVGWLDLTKLSSGYYLSLKEEFQREILLLFLVAGLGGVFIVFNWKTKIFNRYKNGLYNKQLALVICIFLSIFMLALASRPLWHTGHHKYISEGVAQIQAKDNQPIDPFRNYSEYTLNWVGWYIGPILLVAGIIGYILLARRSILKSNFFIVPFLLVLGLTALVFLINPSIRPDQVWASRRLLPVIIPGVAICSGVALELFYRKIKNQTIKYVLWPILIITILSYPLLTTRHFLGLRSYVPQHMQINQICNALPKKSVVIWTGQLRLTAVQPTQIFCDIPAVGLDKPNPAHFKKLVEVAQKNNLESIVGVLNSEALTYYPTTKNFTVVSSVNYPSMEKVLDGPPKKINYTTQTILLSKVQPDGSLSQL